MSLWLWPASLTERQSLCKENAISVRDKERRDKRAARAVRAHNLEEVHSAHAGPNGESESSLKVVLINDFSHDFFLLAIAACPASEYVLRI